MKKQNRRLTSQRVRRKDRENEGTGDPAERDRKTGAAGDPAERDGKRTAEDPAERDRETGAGQGSGEMFPGGESAAVKNAGEEKPGGKPESAGESGDAEAPVSGDEHYKAESLKEYVEITLHKWGIYARIMVKWLAMAYIIGTISGLIGTAFHVGVEIATEFRMEHPWMLGTLPMAGLLIVWLYRFLHTEGQGTNDILEEVQKGRGLPLRLLPAIFVSTVLTHLAGGSAGREGAALQMGGTIGYHTGRFMQLDDKDMRTATMVGMAAFFAALFGTPMAAAVFAMEVISVGLIYHMALIPCLCATLIAYGTSVMLGVEPTHFQVAAPALEGMMLVRVAVLATLSAFISSLFCNVMHGTELLMRKVLKDPAVRVFAGGVLLIVLTFLCGSQAYNGAGMGQITEAVEQGKAFPAAFLLKMLFTAITLSAGFKGGEVVPSFFIGATFGCIVGPLLGIPAGFSAAVGLICVFCGAVNCPLASVFLSVELFGAEGMLYFALACGLSFVLSGYNGLYSSQRILYSKLKAQYIDVRTNAHHAGELTEAERTHR